MAQVREAFLFQPNQVSGCQLWLDGADPNGNGTSVANGASISTWVDKSGNGRNATASVAGTYSLTNRAVVFNNSFYTTSYTAAPTNETGFYVFLTTSSSGPQMILGANSGGREIAIYNSGNQFGIINSMIGWGALTSGGSVTANTVYLGTSQVSGGTSTSVSLNGALSFFGPTSVTAFTSGVLTSLGREGGTSLPFIGNVYEIILYNSLLITSQRQQIEGYLAWKWGLQANLPSTHPFKNYRPLAVQPIPTQVPNMPLITQGTQPFIPTQVSGCQLWLDGVDPNGNGTVPANGASVSTWRDKSASANHASIVSGYTSPTYVTNSLNGRPGLFFNNSVLSTQTPIQLGSFFGVCLTQQNGTLLSAAGSTANNPWSPYYCIVRQQNPVGNALFLLSFTTGTPSYPNYIPTSLNTNYIFAGTYDGVSQMINTINGSDPVSNSFVGGTPKTATATYIGGDWWDGSLAPSLFTLGPIYEIISYSGFVNTAQRQQIEGYLAWKWGLQANLPANHPYKNRPIAPFQFTTVPIPLSLGIWLPTRISGCSLWLDAADRNQLVFTGANVTTWRDKSGNGYNATGNGSTTYDTFNSTSMRGITLNATNTYFLYTGGSAINTTSTLSAFVVSTFDSSTNQYGRLLSFGDPDYNSVSNAVAFNRDTTNNRIMYERTGFPTPAQTLTLPFPFVGSVVFNSTGITQHLNGTFNASTTASFGSFNYSLYNVGRYSGGGFSWGGMICEVISYNASLTTFQRQQVEGYLAWKWGLVASLPANHPYKLWPPAP